MTVDPKALRQARLNFGLTREQAAEVGKMLGGVSANQIGRLANVHGLKTPEYGLEVWDKSPYSPKQVVSWRYNDRAVQRLREIQAEDLG